MLGAMHRDHRALSCDLLFGTGGLFREIRQLILLEAD